jgi:iron(III) transport system substrate-binding protein
VHRSLVGRLALCMWAVTAVCPVAAQDKVLNLYSARHYQTDEALYENFTRATGIRIQRVDTDDAGVLARLKSEGASSPADVVLLVDASRLWRAESEGLFQPVRSQRLEQAIPITLRSTDEGSGSSWFGFSTRARVVVYDKATVARTDVDRYEKLGAPINKGRLCTRSGSHPYNLSLFGAMYQHLGAEQTENWLKGMVANMARAPKGGDTDQIKAVASGECAVALTNSYYLARLMRSRNAADREVVERIGVVFPNQADHGTHVNIAGGAVARHAKHRVAAVQFLEYLSSAEAQRYFADGNNEWPVVQGTRVSNPALEVWGDFRSETVPVSLIGMNQSKIQQILDRVGYR